MTFVDLGQGMSGVWGILQGVWEKFCTLGKCVCKLGCMRLLESPF
jgi:hypothetical protein